MTYDFRGPYQRKQYNNRLKSKQHERPVQVVDQTILELRVLHLQLADKPLIPGDVAKMAGLPFEKSGGIRLRHEKDHCCENKARPYQCNPFRPLPGNNAFYACLTDESANHRSLKVSWRSPYREEDCVPKIGPQKAAFAKTGKTTVLSSADHISEILPPAQVNGVLPKNPAKKRKTSCAARLGASPLACSC